MTKTHKRIAAACFALAAILMGLRSASGADKPTVEVTVERSNGLVLNPDTLDSAKDLEKRLKKSKVLELTDEGAKLELRVVDRGWLEVGSVTARYLPGYGTTVSRDKNRFVIAELWIEGEKITTLVNPPGMMSWGQCANSIRDQLEDIVEANF